jgi:hypothetical protein
VSALLHASVHDFTKFAECTDRDANKVGNKKNKIIRYC